ncbi:MAG: hypothetical protein AAGF59_10740, partial [Pseudomonadota bacterium]
ENREKSSSKTLNASVSTSFVPGSVKVLFDGRSDQGQLQESILRNSSRYRTLGVWDEANQTTLPAFPSPRELRRAFQLPSNSVKHGFLRYANQSDFSDLDRKTSEFLSLWRRSGINSIQDVTLSGFGNLDMLAHIRAGSVDGFLPIFFSSINGQCGLDFGGPQYVPPALYIDAMVCKNTGTRPLDIEDFFGASDRTSGLRLYSPRTPPGEERLNWGPVSLAPGASVVGIQRLLFGAEDSYDFAQDRTLSFDRAVYGPTQLPKGLVIAGKGYAFDGRSHNALVVASYSEEGCCPYLSFWCDRAEEWVSLGKVITQYRRADLEGEETRTLDGLQTRFKLIEREYERSHIRALSLTVELHDGTEIDLCGRAHPVDDDLEWPVILEIGQALEFAFDLPDGIDPENVVRTRLTIRGYYENYTREDFERRRTVMLEAG